MYDYYACSRDMCFRRCMHEACRFRNQTAGMPVSFLPFTSWYLGQVIISLCLRFLICKMREIRHLPHTVMEDDFTIIIITKFRQMFCCCLQSQTIQLNFQTLIQTVCPILPECLSFPFFFSEQYLYVEKV